MALYIDKNTRQEPQNNCQQPSKKIQEQYEHKKKADDPRSTGRVYITNKEPLLDNFRIEKTCQKCMRNVKMKNIPTPLRK